jgi:2-dehydropantoate 2-reductase
MVHNAGGRKLMRYLIVGVGALGSVFGGFLKHAGRSVAFWGRGAHFERLQAQGLTIEGIWGTYQVDGIAPPEAGELYDVILLCVKAFDTGTACRQAKEMLAPGGFVVSMQNGLENLETIAREVGTAHTVGGRVIFGAQITKPGTVMVSVYADQVLLGAMNPGSQPPGLDQVAKDLNRAGIPTGLAENIWPHLWGKVLYNCALNPLGAVLGVPYGELGENHRTRELMRLVIAEIYQVAQARQVSLTCDTAEAYYQFFIEKLVPPTAAHWPSMWQDLQSGRRTEIEALNGAICRYGLELGIPTPYNSVLSQMVRFLQDKAMAEFREVPLQGQQDAEASEPEEPADPAEFKSGVICPKCQRGKMARAVRQGWMRKLPHSRYYYCRQCRARFLIVLGWKFRLPGTENKG